MPALEREPLRVFRVSCSIVFIPVMGPQAAYARSGQAMKAASHAKPEADARRAALMAAAQAGDRIAYETLLRDCMPFITGLARRFGVPPDRTGDVVQEVLLTLHRARATYDPRRSFDAWLRVIVERRAIDLLRQVRRRGSREIHAPHAYESHADDGVDPAAGVEQAERVRQVGTALAGLPPRQREAVHHLMLDERSLDDAAAVTGRSKGSLKVNLHRAIAALRLKMDPGGRN